MINVDEKMIEDLLNILERYDSTLIVSLPRWAQNT
jgi:hypothetical protein